jgi:hypothetical protein
LASHPKSTLSGHLSLSKPGADLRVSSETNMIRDEQICIKIKSKTIA